MSGWKVFLTVVVVLVVIGLLVGGGYCLYRFGYARGFAAAGALGEYGRLPRDFGWQMPGFESGRIQVWPHRGMMIYGGHMPFGMIGFGGWVIPLLLLAGVVTLVVLGIRALIRKPAGTELHAVATPAAPAVVEPAPVKPARGARKTRAR